MTKCHFAGCPRGPRWLYIHEYNQYEGYVRRFSCQLHTPESAKEGGKRLQYPDVRLPSGVGWPNG